MICGTTSPVQGTQDPTVVPVTPEIVLWSVRKLARDRWLRTAVDAVPSVILTSLRLLLLAQKVIILQVSTKSSVHEIIYKTE